MPSAPEAVMDRRGFLAASIGLSLATCSQRDLLAATNSAALADVLTRDAMGQAELIRRKEIQPIELVDAVIAQIEKLNPQLNAVVTPMYDLAREAAKGAIPEGPFRGVPFLLKDLIASYAGVRMAEGSKCQRDYVPKSDSELVARLKRAGLITVGKTNTPEFGMTATTEPHLFGPTHNPWDLSRTPGGSSGGSAAAVAARIVPLAHANDGGGSIRIPASACGLFGLKPTRGRNPLAPEITGIFNGIVAEHAVTITVRDSAALLDATSGPVGGDRDFAPAKRRPFLEEVGAAPGRLRVAFSKRSVIGTEVHADCMAAIDDAARLLESLGHQVEEAAPAIEIKPYLDADGAIWSGITVAVFESVGVRIGRALNPDDCEPINWVAYLEGKKVTTGQYLRAIGHMQSVSRQVSEFLGRFDVWLTPTLGTPPPALGVLHPRPGARVDDITQWWDKTNPFTPFTPLANYTGLPAMSAPLYWNQSRLPIGVHFLGRFGDEATLFRLAAQLEEARPWAKRRPPLSVESTA